MSPCLPSGWLNRRISLARAFCTAIVLLFSGLSHLPADAATPKPTLIRLSIWGPPESRDSIDAVYKTTLEPILVRHGLRPSTDPSRPTIDSVYARLLEVPSPAAFAALKASVQRDSLWRHALHLDADTTSASAGFTKARFDFYRSPAGPGQSVKARPGVHSGNWEILDSSSGLPHDVAYQVAFDPDGVAWIATHSRGLVRYDGLTITNYTQADGLPGNGAGELAVTSSGSVWIRTQGQRDHLVHFDGETFEVYDDADGLPFHYATGPFAHIDRITRVHVAATDDVWLGTLASGLLRLHRDADGTIDLVRYPTADGGSLGEVSNIQDDAGGRLWVTVWEATTGRLYRLDGESLHVVEAFEGADHVSLALGPKGAIWIGAKSSLYKRDGDQWIRRELPDDPGNIWDFHVQEDGTVWTVSPAGLQQRQGDSVIDHAGAILSKWGLVTQSPDGAIWMGTWGAGLARSSINSIQSWDSPHEQVHTALERPDGALWIATQRGIFRFEDGQFTEAFKDTRNISATDLTEDRDGNIWMTQPWPNENRPSRVTRTDADSTVAVPDEDGLPFERVREVFVADNGNLWLVGGGRIVRHNGERFERFGRKDGFPANGAHSVCQSPAGDLWFAHGRFAVTRLAAGSQPRPETLSVHLGPPGVEWSDADILCSKSGDVWAAGQGGISRFDQQTQHWTYYVDHPAWAIGRANTLAEDEAGHLLLALDRGGIARYDGQVFQFLDRRDGLARGSAYDVLLTRDRSIWITTSTGLTRYRPSPGKPHLSMQGLLADRDYSHDEVISFASGQRRVEITYQGRDLKTRPEAMVYRYRLAGFDSTHSTTNETSVIYHDLPSGDYTFEVEAVDRDLGYSDLVTLKFRVHPPYTQIATVSGLILALCLAGWQTVRVVRRDRRLTEQNLQLEQRAQEMGLEAAAERVRAAVMEMNSADEIHNVVGIVRRELVGFGFNDGITVVIDYVEEGDEEHLFAYFALPNPRRFDLSWTSPDLWEVDEQNVSGLIVHSGAESTSLGETRWVPDMSMDWFYDYLSDRYGVDEQYRHAVRLGTHQSGVGFAHGQIGVMDDDFLTAEQIDIVHALCDALSLGLLRYKDFQQLEQASTNKSQFLRRMSHDLRSPMNAIIGYSRLLRRRLADKIDERDTRNLGNIETSSGNLLNLINDILDLSRIEAGRTEINEQSVDVRQLADECADALESIVRENVVLRRDLDDVGVIHSDPDRLRQIVMNLLGNATKFTETGSITLTLKRVSGGTTATDSSSAGTVDSGHAAGSDSQLVELSIADTGIGIPADDLPHIFDEFRQVERQGGEQAEGTGLGLAIAKKTVDLLGGEITAASEVGVGTTFTVRLGAS